MSFVIEPCRIPKKRILQMIKAMPQEDFSLTELSETLERARYLATVEVDSSKAIPQDEAMAELEKWLAEEVA